MKFRIAAAAFAFAGFASVSVLPASAAHRYNVVTGNGECKPTAASATDNANDPAKEQSENAEGGLDIAEERSPAIQGTGFSRFCTE